MEDHPQSWSVDGMVTRSVAMAPIDEKQPKMNQKWLNTALWDRTGDKTCSSYLLVINVTVQSNKHERKEVPTQVYVGIQAIHICFDVRFRGVLYPRISFALSEIALYLAVQTYKRNRSYSDNLIIDPHPIRTVSAVFPSPEREAITTLSQASLRSARKASRVPNPKWNYSRRAWRCPDFEVPCGSLW